LYARFAVATQSIVPVFAIMEVCRLFNFTTSWASLGIHDNPLSTTKAHALTGVCRIAQDAVDSGKYMGLW